MAGKKWTMEECIALLRLYLKIRPPYQKAVKWQEVCHELEKVTTIKRTLKSAYAQIHNLVQRHKFCESLFQSPDKGSVATLEALCEEAKAVKEQLVQKTKELSNEPACDLTLEEAVLFVELYLKHKPTRRNRVWSVIAKEWSSATGRSYEPLELRSFLYGSFEKIREGGLILKKQEREKEGYFHFLELVEEARKQHDENQRPDDEDPELKDLPWKNAVSTSSWTVEEATLFVQLYIKHKPSRENNLWTVVTNEWSKACDQRISNQNASRLLPYLLSKFKSSKPLLNEEECKKDNYKELVTLCEEALKMKEEIKQQLQQNLADGGHPVVSLSSSSSATFVQGFTLSESMMLMDTCIDLEPFLSADPGATWEAVATSLNDCADDEIGDDDNDNDGLGGRQRPMRSAEEWKGQCERLVEAVRTGRSVLTECVEDNDDDDRRGQEEEAAALKRLCETAIVLIDMHQRGLDPFSSPSVLGLKRKLKEEK